MPEKVLLDPIFRPMDRLFSPEELARLNAMAEIVWARNEPMPEDEVDAIADQLSGIICAWWRYGSVEKFPRLRAIMEVAGGFPSPDSLDYEACFRRGIRVLSCAPGFAPAVAEMALGLAIASARGITEEDSAFRAGAEHWGSRGDVDDFLLFDKPVGFIGFGNLARVLQSLLAPFRCRISAYDPWLTDAALRDMGVTPVPLDDLLASSKVIFVLATPTRSNRAMLDRTRLEKVPSDSVFVLISRSHVVDFEALTELLLDGRFKAAIDVFPTEPLPADHPIRGASNVILSPHRAGGGIDTYRLIGRMVADDLEAILAGLPPRRMQIAQPEYIAHRG